MNKVKHICIYERLKKFLILMALPAIMLMYYNQSANWHYHVLENGLVVEHSHPFKSKQTTGTPFQNHNHSERELFVFCELSNLSVLLAFFLPLTVFFIRNSNLPVPEIDLFFPGINLADRLLRAPPSL